MRTVDDAIEAVRVESASAGGVRQRRDADHLHMRNSTMSLKLEANQACLLVTHGTLLAELVVGMLGNEHAGTRGSWAAGRTKAIVSL